MNKKAVISATIGEHHEHQQALLGVIDIKVGLGVDIVKLPISTFFDDITFLLQLKDRAINQNIKLVAVMFADEHLDRSWIPKLAMHGFYGVMLDTNNKQQNLLCSISEDEIQSFVNDCKSYHLLTGLAGSLRVEYVDSLIKYSPSYIGFRSGVCVNFQRDNDLSLELVLSVKNKLYKRNIANVKEYT